MLELKNSNTNSLYKKYPNQINFFFYYIWKEYKINIQTKDSLIKNYAETELHIKLYKQYFLSE